MTNEHLTMKYHLHVTQRVRGLFGTAFTFQTQRPSISVMKNLLTCLDNIPVLINFIVFHTFVNIYVEKCSGLEYI